MAPALASARAGVRKQANTGPAYTITDTFTTSGTNAGKTTTTGGKTWTNLFSGGTGLTRSAGMLTTGVSPGDNGVDYLELSRTSYTLECDAFKGDTSSALRMLFRFSNFSNYWCLDLLANGTVSLRIFNGGFSTDYPLVTGKTAPRLKVEVTPTQVKSYVDGTLYRTDNDSTHGTNTAIGYYMSGGDIPMRVDNLGVI